MKYFARIFCKLASLIVFCAGLSAQNTYLYNAGYASNIVSGYSIDSTTGSLTAVPGSPYAVPPGSTPSQVATDSQCRHAYVANWDATLSAFSINPSDGSLTSILSPPTPSNSHSPWVAVDPQDTHVFVANYSDSTISVYNQANGVLTAASGSPFPSGGSTPEAVAVDATGKFLFSLNEYNPTNSSVGLLAAFAIGPSGSLTLVGSYNTRYDPRGLTIAPSNKFLYVSNTQGYSVSAFAIDQTSGTLTEIQGSPFAAPYNIYQFAIHPSGTYGWLGTDSGALYSYSIDPTTGAISQTSGIYFGPNPSTLTFEPTGRWFYSNNQGGADVLDQWSADSSTSAHVVGQFAAGHNATYSSVCKPVPYKAAIQQPINADGSSVFGATRGVVPVKWTLSFNGTATCSLPPATIALSRLAGGTSTPIDESTYEMSADVGSNYRISGCQYVYNLRSSSLGVGSYTVSINVNGTSAGSIGFALK